MKFSLSRVVAALLLWAAPAMAGPVISSFSPAYGWSNSPAIPGNVVTITGSGFYPGTLLVKFNGVQATNYMATQLDGTEIQAQVRIGTPSGTGPVVVTVNGIQAPTNNGVFFSVIGPNDPYVTGFAPAGGVAGSTSVTLTGVHFAFSSAITAVKFNGVSASFRPVTQDGTVTATVPATAQTGFITVQKTGAATFTSSTPFYVSPNITSFTPTSGRAGTNVVILGTSFVGATAVKFGNLPASFTVDSNTQITAVAPSGVLTGTLRVEAPGGTNITSASFVVVPDVASFSPGVGSPGTVVTISGANLLGTTSVKFGGIPAAFGNVTFNSLTATVPAGATNGTLSVTTADGTGTSTQLFYVPAAITGFVPANSPPGSVVKITGDNFSGTSAVDFNGLPATSFVVSNNTTIGAIVPGGITTGPISITTPAGVATSASLFYVAPVIAGFAPNQGVPGNSVMISGVNFLGTTAVQFNGTNASFVVTNNSVIGAIVPANAASGPLTVVAPAGTNVTTESFLLNYTNDLSVSVTNSPNPVFVASNLVYTISVANAAGPYVALNVMLTNTLPASVILKSATTTQGTLNTNANPIIASLGTIPLGSSAFITLTVAPQTTGPIADTAQVGSDNVDPNLSNNTATTTAVVWPPALLGIQTLDAAQVKVFWPSVLSNFTLLYQNNLASPAGTWNTDLTTRAISGANISVTETNLGGSKLFRLRQ